MSLDPMPSVAELRRMARERGVIPPEPSKAPAVRAWAPYRSKWEWEYAQRLSVLMAAGRILDWTYEPRSFVIGVKAKYKPDFRVVLMDQSREWHEVKGYRREASIVRIKAAAKQYPDERFIIATKLQGDWHLTPVAPAPALARPRVAKQHNTEDQR